MARKRREFKDLTPKQKAWLEGTLKKEEQAIKELLSFLKSTKQRKGAEFWTEYGRRVDKAFKAIFAHQAAIHKIKGTYYDPVFHEEFALRLRAIAHRIKKETGFVMEDWINYT